MVTYSEFSYEKWWFAIAILVYQRVFLAGIMDWFLTVDQRPGASEFSATAAVGRAIQRC